MLQSNIKLVGMDYFSIEPFDSKNHEIHKILFKKNVLILECINLFTVQAGAYRLICLPLKISSPDGAPARAILSKQD